MASTPQHTQSHIHWSAVTGVHLVLCSLLIWISIELLPMTVPCDFSKIPKGLFIMPLILLALPKVWRHVSSPPGLRFPAIQGSGQTPVARARGWGANPESSLPSHGWAGSEQGDSVGVTQGPAGHHPPTILSDPAVKTPPQTWKRVFLSDSEASLRAISGLTCPVV